MKHAPVATHILWWLPESSWEGDEGPAWALDLCEEFNQCRLRAEAVRCDQPLDADVRSLALWTAGTLGHPVGLVPFYEEDGTPFYLVISPEVITEAVN